MELGKMTLSELIELLHEITNEIESRVMELGYVANPKVYIDKEFSELSTAIIASSSEAE